MAYASRSGRAQVSATNPRAFGVCQRCGIWWNRDRLQNQREWRGSSLMPIYIWVCPQCYDTPQEQLRAITLPADPLPVYLPLPEPFFADEISYMGLAGSTIDPTTGIPIPNTTAMQTQGGAIMTPEPYGRPDGLEIDAVMPLALTNGVPTHYGVPLNLLSVIADGSDQIAVTTRTPHGLSTKSQIAVEGLSNSLADGFYSVVVTSATAFTYQTYAESVPAGPLLTPTTLMVTAQVGLPLGYDTISQVGP